jgi:hypothetical protein
MGSVSVSPRAPSATVVSMSANLARLLIGFVLAFSLSWCLAHPDICFRVMMQTMHALLFQGDLSDMAKLFDSQLTFSSTDELMRQLEDPSVQQTLLDRGMIDVSANE